MIIHDISRDTLTTPVYEGDPETEVTAVRSMEDGDEYNLSAVSMCVHAGTHIDAPLHFSARWTICGLTPSTASARSSAWRAF